MFSRIHTNNSLHEYTLQSRKGNIIIGCPDSEKWKVKLMIVTGDMWSRAYKTILDSRVHANCPYGASDMFEVPRVEFESHLLEILEMRPSYMSVERHIYGDTTDDVMGDDDEEKTVSEDPDELESPPD